MEEHVPLIRATVAPPTRGYLVEERAQDGRRHADARGPSSTSPAAPPSTPTSTSTVASYYELDVYMGHAKRFISDLKPYEALALVPLSFGEMALTKVTGTVAGSVYKALVDLDSQLLYSTVYKATMYYALFAVLTAAQEYVKDSLALTWRRRLTNVLHGAYFRDPLRMRVVHSKLDNCDQRMTSEVEGLCSTLADIVQKVAGSPFKVLFYGYLAGTYIGVSSLGLVVAFFSVSIWLQKLVALPLARELVLLERQEGDFRSQHMRVRGLNMDIGLQAERTAEAWALNRSLDGVLGVQGAVVWRRTAVMAITRLVDYGGALMNYVVIAAAVFWGGAGGSGDASADSEGGDRAAFVSNASFFTLTFIYTLTEIVDLGSSVSTMISLLCRVYSMLDVLQEGREDHDRVTMDPVEQAEHGGPPGLGLVQSSSACSPRGEYEVVLEPTSFELGAELPETSPETSMKNAIMEVAVLTLRGALLDEVVGVFPSMQQDSSVHSNALKQVTCVMTLQPRQPLDLDAMDASLSVFLVWERAMAQQLRGAWCDAVDPKTGKALRDIGSSAAISASWSEVRAFHAFLKYPVDERGACPLIVHPAYGSDTYPASFFTTASPQSCIEALERIGNLHDCRGLDDDPAVLRIQNETIWRGELSVREGAPLLTGINLRLEPGRHVLVTGPNGAGKTTLIRYLCKRLQEQGLQRRQVAHSHRNHGSRYVYLPQIPLIAPGRFLWQQLAYPSHTKPSDGDMLDVLQRVGLGELAVWLPEHPSTARDWATCLSYGEQQRLCIARVCLCKPSFALMDEAASGMETDSSVRLIREVQRVTTVVLVAHDVEALSGLFSVRVDL